MKNTPSAQTGFDPYAKRTPSPPPPLRSTSSRSAESSSSASVSARPPPPPVHRTSRPDAAPLPVLPRRNPSTIDHSSSSVRAYGDEQQRESADRINWSNLSPEDKQAFFSWLDEFFSQYLGRPVGPIKAGVHPISGFAGSETLSASWRRTLPPPLAPLTGPVRSMSSLPFYLPQRAVVLNISLNPISLRNLSPRPSRICKISSLIIVSLACKFSLDGMAHSSNCQTSFMRTRVG